MMEDSSSDDDLPGPSTRSRVKRKEWPDPDDRGGTSSKKVGGGSGRTPQGKNSEEMTKEEKKKEAARLRKAQSRAKQNDIQKYRKQMFFFYHSFPLLSWNRLGIVLESFRNCLRLNVELSLNNLSLFLKYLSLSQPDWMTVSRDSNFYSFFSSS